MNTIHQISLKLRLGIDTRANIPPEVLLEKWQDLNDRRFFTSNLPPASEKSQLGELQASGSNNITCK